MTPKELATAIRRGHTMIGETKLDYLRGDCGCALGAAAVGCGKQSEFIANMANAAGAEGYAKQLAPVLGISTNLFVYISNKHISGTPRLAIADWLDTLDVSKPKDAQTFDAFMKAAMVPVDVGSEVAVK